MLVIETKMGTEDIIWYVNQKFDPKIKNTIVHHTISVTADGDELINIDANFKGIPIYDTNSMTWYGDLAKTIALAIFHRHS